ncbi:MAG TPA: sensor histidine kinase [Vicinamibacteria bacterium]
MLPVARDAPSTLTARALLDAREQEARRIAGALHDESGQLLAALDVAIDELARTGEPVRGLRAAELKSLVRTIEEQLRRIAHEMRPRILDDLGLRPALENLAAGVSARSGVEVAVRGGFGGRLPGSVETTFYRIAQEAVTNAVRHGRPRSITIELSRERDLARCAIRDDGVGFAASDGSGGLGLAGMRERAEAAGGTFSIRSSRRRGTLVEASVPLEGGSPSRPGS